MKMGIRASYIKTNRCAETSTTDCVRYVGVDIPCLDICSGDMMTSVENAIAVKLCELVGQTDISTLTIPDCFTVKDVTILNTLNFLLETACNQQNLITDLQTNSLTIDSPIVVNYPPCCTDECNLNVNLTISGHFEKILMCLCQQADRITALQAQVDLLPTITQFNSLKQEVTDIKSGIIAWNLSNPTNPINI